MSATAGELCRPCQPFIAHGVLADFAGACAGWRSDADRYSCAGARCACARGSTQSLKRKQVPDETTLLRWLRTLRPETLHAVNDRVVQLAVQAKATRGRRLRLDATCVQTEIHHPTDSGLLVDSVRVLSRIVKRAKGFITGQVSSLEQTCRSRVRSARKTAQTLHRQLRRKGEDKEAEQKQLYQKLIETAEQMVQQTTQVIKALGEQSESQAKRLLTQAQDVLPLVERVIAQTRSRVLEGKKVASEKKVLSLFEPHTRATKAVPWLSLGGTSSSMKWRAAS